MKIIIDMLASLFNWFKIRDHNQNKVWYFMDNVFLRCYLAGKEWTEKNGKRYKGLQLCIITKNHPDCTGGFKSIRPHYFWIIRSQFGNFGKGGLWRKWDNFASLLKMRFWYI